MKDIKGFEGLYAITEDGRVWGYKRKKFRNPKKTNGYLRIALCKDGVYKDYFIHCLVAEAYIPNPYNLPQVNHKDENKENNSVDNLEWCDSSYNINYGTRNNKVGKANSKPIYCIELDKVFDSLRKASIEIGVSKTCICECLHGKQKTAGGYHWRYADELLAGTQP